jgi:hypothetical protein
MGLHYFPQLETAMCKANLQIASEKGLALSTILGTDNSLPHLTEDWRHPYSDWPLLLDASSFKVIPPSSISSGDSNVFLALTLKVFERRK